MITGPVSFPIISIVKLVRKWVLLEFSTLGERHWMLSTETFKNYTQDAAEKFKLTFNSSLAGPGRVAQSVGHLTRKSGVLVRYPVWQHTFVSHSAFSRRSVVSYWRKYVHEVLVSRTGGPSLPRKSVVRLTDRPDMTLDVYRGRKTTIKQQQQQQQQIPVYLITFGHERFKFDLVTLRLCI